MKRVRVFQSKVSQKAQQTSANTHCVFADVSLPHFYAHCVRCLTTPQPPLLITKSCSLFAALEARIAELETPFSTPFENPDCLSGVQKLFHSNLLINQTPRQSFNSFESLILSLIWKYRKPVLFVVICHPPGPY